MVFHPHITGKTACARPRYRGDPDAPFYEKTTVARAVDNAVYVASAKDALPNQESATCVIGLDGRRLARLPYAEEEPLVVDLDLDQATGWAPYRLAPARYGDRARLTARARAQARESARTSEETIQGPSRLVPLEVVRRVKFPC